MSGAASQFPHSTHATAQGSTLTHTPEDQLTAPNSPLPKKSLGQQARGPRASDSRIGAVPDILPDSSAKVKDFPLSTKNKSMPPFSLPNNQNSAHLNRNLPPVVVNPIQQAKSQYYKQHKSQPKSTQTRQALAMNTHTLM